MSKKMQSELVAILSDLIALPSPYPPGTSVEICAYTAKRLKKAGFEQVYVLDGGILGWQQADLPLVKGRA